MSDTTTSAATPDEPEKTPATTDSAARHVTVQNRIIQGPQLPTATVETVRALAKACEENAKAIQASASLMVRAAEAINWTGVNVGEKS